MLLLLLSLLLLWPAQNGQLRGYVDDTVTGERLVGATVVLERAGSDPIGTATDGDGFYLLPRVPAGTYQLRVSFIGYEPFVGTVRVSDGETTDQDVRLQPATGELGEVLVEAVGASGVTAVAAGLQTVRPADIERALMPGATGDLAMVKGLAALEISSQPRVISAGIGALKISG
ncbi:MAG: carboxypeptidase-like regulatory domain-containing protein, partial [Bacteroidota bacterium]